MIGIETEQGGLYYLDTPLKTKCNLVTATIFHSLRLWHQRLGHLSNRSFRLLSHLVASIKFCDVSDFLICLLAK